jgi:hypothetical protein
MASQVLSGSGEVTYTNNTGQNVRIVINYLRINNRTSQQGAFSVSWGGGGSAAVSCNGSGSVGRGIGGSVITATGNNQSVSSQNFASTGAQSLMDGCPLELVIEPTATFSIESGSGFISIGGYNIVVIPEAG